MQENIIFKASVTHIILKRRPCKQRFFKYLQINQFTQPFQYMPSEEENFQICCPKYISITISPNIQYSFDQLLWQTYFEKVEFAREKELASLHKSIYKQSLDMENGNTPNYFTKMGYSIISVSSSVQTWFLIKYQHQVTCINFNNSTATAPIHINSTSIYDKHILFQVNENWKNIYISCWDKDKLIMG